MILCPSHRNHLVRSLEGWSHFPVQRERRWIAGGVVPPDSDHAWLDLWHAEQGTTKPGALKLTTSPFPGDVWSSDPTADVWRHPCSRAKTHAAALHRFASGHQSGKTGHSTPTPPAIFCVNSIPWTEAADFARYKDGTCKMRVLCFLMILTGLTRATGALYFVIDPACCPPFTAVTRVQIPSGTPNLFSGLTKTVNLIQGTKRHRT
jgi:hypothetical protein